MNRTFRDARVMDVKLVYLRSNIMIYFPQALTLALIPLLGLYRPLRVLVREDLECKVLEKVDPEYVLTQEACSSNDALFFHSENSCRSSITTQGNIQEQVCSTESLDSVARVCHGRMMVTVSNVARRSASCVFSLLIMRRRNREESSPIDIFHFLDIFWCYGSMKKCVHL